MRQPRLDHSSTAFLAAKAAEEKLLAAYGLTARDQWVEVDGLRVRVLIIGEGPPVFISPGNTGDGYAFIPFVAKMPGFTFFILNRPGGGLSDGMDHSLITPNEFVPALYSRVFDALGLKSAPAIGHSMGCHWLALFAIAHPQRVSRAVFIGNPGNMLLEKAPLPMRMLLLPGVGEFIFKRLLPKSPADGMKIQRMFGSDLEAIARLPAALIEATYVFEQLPNYVTSMVTLLRKFASNAPGGKLAKPDLAKYAPKTLLIWGSKDTFSSVERGREISASMVNGEFALVEGAGHMPFYDRL
ncbi:MAG: alpha/beta fold hydrolase [Archangium sp.]